MKTLQSLENQIITLTTSIEVNYPELYALLDENPMTISTVVDPKMNISVMEDYLESLKQILKQYIKTYKKF